jgi:hypothetical protein
LNVTPLNRDNVTTGRDKIMENVKQVTKQVTKSAFVKLDDLESGSKLIMAYAANGSPLLKKGRFCFYDTKFGTVY